MHARHPPDLTQRAGAVVATGLPAAAQPLNAPLADAVVRVDPACAPGTAEAGYSGTDAQCPSPQGTGTWGAGAVPSSAAPSARPLAASPGIGGAPRPSVRWPALLPLVPAVLCAAVAFSLPAPAQWAQLPLAGIASALAMLALVLMLRPRLGGRRDVAFARRIATAHAHDPDALVVTDSAGDLLAANPAALADKSTDWGTDWGDASPVALLTRDCADPRRMVDTLIAEALTNGHARRKFARAGSTLMLQVHALAGGQSVAGQTVAGQTVAGQTTRDARGMLVWRLARLAQEGTRPLDMLGLPVLSIGPDGAVLAANRAIRALCPALSAPPPPGEGSALLLLARQLARATAEGDNRPVPTRLDDRPYLARPVPAEDGQVDVLFIPAPTADAPAAPEVDTALPGALVATGLAATAPGPSALTAFSDFEEIPVALMMIGADGRIRRSNRLARTLFCIEPGDAVYFSELVEGLGRPVADWLADAHAGRSLNRPEVLRAIHPAQETFVQIILRRAPAPSNGLFAVISDATELKSLEARFAQSQKMQAIGQLAGGVAHDFNNLLTAISGHCDLLLINRDYYDPEYDDLMQIHQNANRAAALVRQLLAFSRKQTMKPEMLPLESLLEDLAHLLTRLVGERITLCLVHDSRLGPIWADRRQLEQVILNLVVNARDAMPMGGEIRIETRALTLTQEEEHGRARLPAGDYAVIHVRDEGIGIPDDNLDKIFEPFFTTKKPGEGTGLGLSTAYGIVKQMGGYIFADSTEGIGTRFTLYFAAQLVPGAQGGDISGDKLRDVMRDGLGDGAAALVPIHPVPARQAAHRVMPGNAIDAPPGATQGDRLGHGAATMVPIPAALARHAAHRVMPGDITDAPSDATLAEGVDGFGPVVDAPAVPATEISSPTRTHERVPSDPAPESSAPERSAPAPAPEGSAPASAERAPLPGETGRVESALAGGIAGQPAPSSAMTGRVPPDPGGAVAPGAFMRSAGAAAPAPRTAPMMVPVPARGAGVAVLLVEDEAPVRAFAARALRLQGYKVIEAESGEQALQFLQTEGLQVDIFVSDVIMPGLDGPGWVARALAARPRTPVVFMSGYAEDSLSAALSRTPGAVFLDKPFTLNGLCRVIEQQLDKVHASPP